MARQRPFSDLLRPPAFDDAFDLATIVRRIDGVLLPREIGEHRRHVLRDLPVDGEQEVRHPAALAGIVVRDVQQLLEGKSDAVFNVLSSQQP